MSALAIVALLAVTLFLPAFVDNAEDDATPGEPETPDEPAVVNGTAGADLLTAGTDQTVNGLDGNDTLSVVEESDGAIINGDAGDDTLTLDGTNSTARGGTGDDTIVSTNVFNGIVEGGDGNDDISFTPLRASDALDGTEENDNSRVDGGAGNDTIRAGGYGGEVFGGEGDDEILAQGPMGRVDGGSGNDQISYDSSVFDGGSTPVLGGDGNDTISHTSLDGNVERLASANIDAGEGDDIIETDTYIGSDGNTIEDTLTGGEGSDGFVMSFFNDTFAGDDRDAGRLATITDFDPNVDALLLGGEIQLATNESDSTERPGQITGFSLVEAEDDSFTDVIFEATSTASDSATVTGTVRLLGATGVTEANISITAADAAATT